MGITTADSTDDDAIFPTAQAFKLAPIDRNPTLLEQSLLLLQDEWPVSEGLQEKRRHSMEQPSVLTPTLSELLPVHLALVDSLDDKTVVGHAKLCPGENCSLASGESCEQKATSCILCSLVIAKEFRGRGRGRDLVRALEAFCKANGLCYLYLFCKPELVPFYQGKLGFVDAQPISSMGSVGAKISEKSIVGLQNMLATKLQQQKSQSNNSQSGFVKLGHAVSKTEEIEEGTVPSTADVWLKKCIMEQHDIGSAGQCAHEGLPSGSSLQAS